MGLIPGSNYAGGGVLPGYQNPVPTQERRRTTRQIPTPTPPQQPQYTSIAEVVRNYKAGNITYSEAYQILRNQFGLSDNDIQDVMQEIQPIGPPLPPETEPEPEPEPEPQGETETVDSGFTLSENQRFLLIGLLVIGIGSRMIIKRD